MPRANCDDIRWDTTDPRYHEDLPEDVSVYLDEGYDPDYEPEDTVAREFGCRVLSLNVDSIED